MQYVGNKSRVWKVKFCHCKSEIRGEKKRISGAKYFAEFKIHYISLNFMDNELNQTLSKDQGKH